jgi:hypothetical protein
MAKHPPVEVGYQVFLEDGGEEVGAVREAGPDPREVTIYIENSGDFLVPEAAIRAVHYNKVILDREQLSAEILEAIGKAHDAEDPRY